MAPQFSLSQDAADAPARVGIFDAGIGGLPMADLVQRSRPDLEIVYLGDAGRRPYGPRSAESVSRYVLEAEAFMASQGVTAWAIACNTASVVAPAEADRRLPAVDMVAAVEPLLRRHADPVALLGTAGTVASGVFPARYPATNWLPLATEELLREAEEGGEREGRVLELLRELRVALEESQVSEAVLACTDYTCILPTMRAELPGVALLDPVGAAAAQLTALVPQRVGAPPPVHQLFLTGQHPCDVLELARSTYGIEFEGLHLVALGA